KETASFGFIQTNLGILPGWGGGALLYDKVHPTFALHWVTEGTVYDAKQLAGKDWLHRVIPAEAWEDEQHYLHAYKRKSLEQMQFIKSQYAESLSVPTLLIKMEKEIARCATICGTVAHRTAVGAFFNCQ